ncbi:MAG: hypothetical protein HYR75_04650 [Gemmatimonadetes bacterium]|nr:hypothetical protein [Gemmatimonadota bacterium]MBI3567540.1 hypothetical protein [Gemmatimonadota bacterium]
MTWRISSEADVRVAAAAVVVAGALALGAVWQATRIAPVDPAPPMPAPVVPVASAIEQPVPFDRMIALAPFSPDRRATPPAATVVVTSLNLAGTIRLVGTVVGDGAPFAVCRAGSARPRTLHAGDTLSGWTLKTIAPARVTFIDAAGATHELRLNSPGN